MGKAEQGGRNQGRSDGAGEMLALKLVVQDTNPGGDVQVCHLQLHLAGFQKGLGGLLWGSEMQLWLHHLLAVRSQVSYLIVSIGALVSLLLLNLKILLLRKILQLLLILLLLKILQLLHLHLHLDHWAVENQAPQRPHDKWGAAPTGVLNSGR
ncbi:hypothetical protein CB1_001217003 [Camelus ferus]|nr:hypothetical protein CB1_001217003 [Camelus ferus]